MSSSPAVEFWFALSELRSTSTENSVGKKDFQSKQPGKRAFRLFDVALSRWNLWHWPFWSSYLRSWHGRELAHLGWGPGSYICRPPHTGCWMGQNAHSRLEAKTDGKPETEIRNIIFGWPIYCIWNKRTTVPCVELLKEHRTILKMVFLTAPKT